MKGIELTEKLREIKPDIAVGATRVLKKKGYRIPNDVSVIGFDNSYLVKKCRPNLSSVHIYKKRAWRVGGEALKREYLLRL